MPNNESLPFLLLFNVVVYRQKRQTSVDIEPVEKGRSYILQFFLSSNSGV